MPEAKAITIIGQGTLASGEIKSKGTIRIEGAVEGKIHCEDTVVVQESGKVKAEIVAAQIVISGEVKGNVFAHDRLEITANGRLVGDITAPKVSIAEGVIFEGKCSMKPPAQPKSPQQGPPAQQNPPRHDG